MEEFLRFLITPLLSNPKQLAIKPSTYMISIAVDPADMGRVIGKGGAVITAIRNLTRAYSISHQLSFTTITISEPSTPTPAAE